MVKGWDEQPGESSLLGPLLVGLEGTRLSARERELLQHPALGGVVLFTRNYAAPEQLSELTEAIRAAAGRPLLITVDHEGGRVQRFRDGFARLPALGVLGKIHARRADMGCDLAYRHGRVMATELLLRGVDLSFAPVLDLDRGSTVIGDRSFSGSIEAVSELGAFYTAGMKDAGMRSCGKHFPGHGSVAPDSHTEDVVDERALATLRDNDLAPFRACLERLDSIMMAHVVYPAVDARPAGYSRHWVQDLLRGELGYRGTVFSDDLVMHAARIAGKLSDRLDAALEAGCDAALVCDPEAALGLLEELAEAPADATEALLRLRGHCQHTAAEVESVGEWRYWRKSIEELEQTEWA